MRAAYRPPGAVTGPSRARYSVLAWLCLAATIAYISRNSIAVAESTIRRDLGLTEQQMGAVISAFFLTYAVAQIPTAWLGEVWGSRRAIPVFSCCWSLATAAMGLALGAPMLLATRLANGMSQAGLFPCCTNTISKWFPATQRGIASGALGSFMSAGGAIGAAVTGVLIVRAGWRWTFALYSLLGCFWAAGFYRWFRDEPQEHSSVNAAELALIRSTGGDGGPELAEPSRSRTPWLEILSSPAMWWICSQQFFRAAGYMFFGSWFATYLQETRGVTPEGSGFLTMLPLLAVVAGGLLGGGASDWVLARFGSLRWARQGVASAALLACGSLIVSAYFVGDALWAVALISAGSLFHAVAGPCSYAITIDMGGRDVGTVFSVMNMSGNVGAMIFPYVVPWLRNATGGWESILFLFAGMFFAAAICWLLLNPRGAIVDQALVHSSRQGSGDASR